MREDIEMGSQISMFDGETQFKITKPLRLIELFGGYGSQSLALKYLGVPFEHWRLCEWAIPSIQAYKDLHFEQDTTDYSVGMNKIELVKTLHKLGISSDYNQPLTQEKLNRYSESKLRTIYNNIRACHNLVSICNVRGKDLGIQETDKYCYLMTYSFPCQDISAAGLGKGMERGRGTRSGLLWEVERLLTETKELPQVLLMENVKQVVGQKNIKAFAEWVAFLDKLGYHSKWQVLNATDFSIPQNRERCFMVSVLGNYSYDFPMICRKRELYDFVDGLPENEINIGHASKTIINSIKKAASYIEAKTIRCGGRGSFDRHMWNIYSIDYKRTLAYFRPPLKNISITLLANKTGLGYSTQEKYFFYSTQEVFRLMGVKNEDYKKLKKAQSKSSLFHLAGDSIVTTCLMAIFGEMCDVDYKTKIEELTKNLTGEQKDDRNRYNKNYESN